MIKQNKNLLRLTFKHYHIYANKSLRIPKLWVSFLLIHSSLRNLSYIYKNNTSSWIYFFVIFIRPSEAIQLEHFSILGAIFIVLHFFFIVFPHVRGCSVISLIDDLLKVAFLNFCIEEFQGVLGMIVGTVILIIQVFEQLFINWTLDVDQKNFQQVNFTSWKLCKLFLDIFLIIGHQYQLRDLLIQYFAIANSLVCGLYILKEKYTIDKITKITVFSIQLFTIYLGIIQFIQYENSYTLIVAPFFFKIASQIRFDFQFLEKKDQILIASIKLSQNNYLDCFKLLFEKQENNILRNVKKQLLQQKCVQQFSQNLYKKNKEIYFEGLALKLKQSDTKKQKVLEQLSKIIHKKIILFENWNKNPMNDFMKFISMVQKLKDYLQKFNEEQPYGAARSTSVYFYCEVLNDILEANELLTHTKKSLEILSKFQQYVQNVFYISFNFQNNQLSIDKISSNTPKKYIKYSFQELLPLGIKEHHDELIDIFLQSGESKYVKSFNKNYIINEGFVESINFAIDLFYYNKIQFYALIQTQFKKEQDFVIISNQYQEITSVSKTVADNLGLHQFFQVGSKVNLILKDFEKITTPHTYESFRYHSFPIQPSRRSFFFIDQQDQSMNYFCDVHVRKQFISDQLAYAIIELQNFRNYVSYNSELLLQTKVSKSLISYKELETLNEFPKFDGIIVPYEFTADAPKLDTDCVMLTSRDDEQALLKLSCQNKAEVSKSARSLSLYKKEVREPKTKEKTKHINQEQFELSSIESSVQFLIQSKYIRKYSLINRFYKHLPLKNQSQFIIALFGLIIFIQCILILIQLSGLNLVQFATDIKLLEIKNLFFQPLDQFLATRWNLWTYNQQKSMGIITSAQYDEYSQFSLSFLGRGYDVLNENLQLVLDKSELQDLLQTKYIEAFQQESTYTYELYNVTLRSAIQILLNFQYILKMNYVYEKTVKADSPQIFYSFKNYPILRDILDQLNEDIMVATLMRGDRYQTQLNIVFICQQVFLILISLSILFFKNRITKKLEMFFTLVNYVNQAQIEKEIEKQKTLLNKIIQDPEFIFNFKFSLYQKEAQFFSKKTDLNLQSFHKFSREHKISQKAFILFLLCFFLFIQVNCFFNFFQYTTYLNKYPKTSLFKKQLSDLCGDIPLMFAQREVLYGRKNYMYLDDAYFNKIFLYIQESLNSTEEFTESSRNYNSMLMSQNFINYYQRMQSADLCSNLPDYLVNKSQVLCPITMSGNMRQGLNAMLIYIQNLIKTDMAINNFTYRAKPTQNELEGAYMISEIILMINNSFYTDLINITTQLIQEIIIFNSLYIFGLVIVLIIIIVDLKQKMFHNSQKLLGLIYLIPEQILFNDEALERTLRILVNI